MSIMEQSKFIVIINAEKHQNVLVRILTILNRQRFIITQMATQLVDTDDILRVTLHISENKEKVYQISKRLNREIDVLDVNLYEQLK